MQPWLAKGLYRFIQLLRDEKVYQYLEELERTQWYSPEQLRQLQFTKLKRLLHHAYDNIPYYKRKFDAIGLLPFDITCQEDLLNVPILTKEDIRNYPHQLLDPNHRFRLRWRKTSGSTGKPLTFLKDSFATGYQQAAMYRGYRWHGLDIGSKQARFWGVPLGFKDKLTEKGKDFVGNRLRFSVWDLTDENLFRYLKRLRSFSPQYLYGYTSGLVKIARFIIENRLDLTDLNLNAIITTSEVLYPAEREVMEQAFGCKVVNEYGAVETGVIALECPASRMHIMAENLIVEFVNDGKHISTGENGQIVVTDLNSFAFPFIRYQIGDIGRASGESCPCGRGLPCMEMVVGRTLDLVMSTNGKLVHGEIFYYIFKQLVTHRREIKQFKIIQKFKDKLLVQLVTSSEFNKNHEARLRQRLQQFLGNDMKIEFQYLDEIPREKSGKLRHFVSEAAYNPNSDD